MSVSQEFQGWLCYQSDLALSPHRLFVAVPCLVGDGAVETYALLDTAAQWCVLPVHATAALELIGEEDQPLRLETRFGAFGGHLERIPVRFPAFEGEDLVVDATFFVSPDWPGPLVLGWKGCLERFRFALDPGAERFYFGS